MLFDDTTLKRFWAKVDKNGPLFNSTPCWLWTAQINNKGYGKLKPPKGMSQLAHRFAYETFIAQIPQDLEIDHLCRNRRCVNPQHMEPVTHAENMKRGIGGHNQRSKTHCPQAHPYDLFNTYIGPTNGDRQCRTCKNEHQRAKRARLKLLNESSVQPS